MLTLILHKCMLTLIKLIQDHIRFTVREKRSASKKALNDLLLNPRFSTSRGQVWAEKWCTYSVYCLIWWHFFYSCPGIDRFIATSIFCQDVFSKLASEDADRWNKKSRIKPAREARRAHHKKVKSSSISETFDITQCGVWYVVPGSCMPLLCIKFPVHDQMLFLQNLFFILRHDFLLSRKCIPPTYCK